MDAIKTPLDRLHELMLRLGISPKVGDPIIAGLVGIVASFIITGAWNVNETKALAVLALYAIVGIGAPPAPNLSMNALKRQLAGSREGAAQRQRRRG